MPSMLSQLESLRDLLVRAHGRKYRKIRFASYDTSALNLIDADLHESLQHYFHHCVPDDSIYLHQYCLASSDELEELQEAWPMPFIRPHGYVAIGSTDSGNAIAIEIVTGRVNVCSHEVFSEKGIGGWNDDCTKWVQTPISPDTIAARAEESFESISAFLDHWIDSATRLLRDGTA